MKDGLRRTLDDLGGDAFKRFKHLLRDKRDIPWGDLEKADKLDTVDLMVQVYTLEAEDVMRSILKKMGFNQLADRLEMNLRGTIIKAVSEKLKLKLKANFESALEGIQKKETPLDTIYTELYIIEGEGEGVNRSHENTSIDRDRKPQTSEGIPITLNDIFKPLNGGNSDKKGKYRVVLTKGNAGIGKTVSVHKFIHDWAEGKANQDVDLMLVLPFRDLNAQKDECSLQELLEKFYPVLRDFKDPKIYDDCNILFIFDGLDESQLPLNFQNNQRESDVTKKCPVDVLITNLIQADRLLSSANIWITSRPAAIRKVSRVTRHRMTEVQGFSDEQKEEYFKKKFDDENVFNRVVSHIKQSRSLHIMCHIPFFCWMLATVLPKNICDALPENIPTTLTAMYTRLLVHQTHMKNDKYHGLDIAMPVSETDWNLIRDLAKLAFEHLLKGSNLFSEVDLTKYEININVSMQSGVFTEVNIQRDPEVNIQRDPEVNIQGDPVIQEKWYSFVHFTIQEYLAALYAIHLFTSEGSNPFPQCFLPLSNNCSISFGDYKKQLGSLHDLHKVAIAEALRWTTGYLDLFLRFLLGLSTDCNAWKHFRLQKARDPKSNKKTIEYIKDMLRDDRNKLSSEQSINFIHCLTELNDRLSNEDILKYTTSLISPALCSALVNNIMTSDKVIEEFDLSKYNTSSEGHSRLVKVLACCNQAKMVDCGLTEKCCKIIAEILQSRKTHLTELDLSNNNLTGINWESLSEALNKSMFPWDPQPKLVPERLIRSAQHLMEAILLRPSTQPCILRLIGCGLKEDVCDLLANAMDAPGATLKTLDLSYNYLTDAGVQKFLQKLTKKNCNLESLRLCACGITDKSCAIMAQVLQQLSLQDLDLSGNRLQDEGAKLICTGLESPHCQLQTLRLKDCNLYKIACAALAPALWSNSELKELDLSDNDLQDDGVKLLSVGLRNSKCHLQTLRLSGCQVTEEGCALLASALFQNPDHLEELDLSYNHPGDRGREQLFNRQEDPQFRLRKLNFDHVGVERLQRGLKKYEVDLKMLDSDGVTLSEDKKKATKAQTQDFVEVKCEEQLSEGRFYWELEWSGQIHIMVKRSGGLPNDHILACHMQPICTTYAALRNNFQWSSAVKTPDPNHKRIGVYLDMPAGLLTFYNVSANERILMYTFKTAFTAPVTPAFALLACEVPDTSSITLCTRGGGPTRGPSQDNGEGPPSKKIKVN